MSARTGRPLLSLALLVALGAAFAWQLGRAERPLPRPTEHRLDEAAEERNHELREQWVEAMHRAAPGTDWRALERANGEARELAAAGRERVGAWTEIGSHNQAGRIHCAAVSVAGDSLYAGADLGGLWKADLAGNGWRPLSDNLYGGVRNGVCAAGVNPEVVTVLSTSTVIRYSEDQGATWLLPAGLPASPQNGLRIQRDPANADRVYLLLASAGLGTELYRSDDAGRSYQLVNHTNNSVADFWVDRVAGHDLYLMISRTLYFSGDLGATWTPLGQMPSTPSKVILAGCEAGAPTFYVAARIAGVWELWRSTDSGASWAFRYGIDDFWETMNCSTTNPNLVAFSGVEVWRSVDGGGSFAKVNGWGEYYGDPLNKLHADNPGLEVLSIPGVGERWFPCTDGGIYISADGLASVTNLSLAGLGVGQYYDVLTSALSPTRIAVGAQDQGYQRADGFRGQAADFQQLISGDYGHLTSGDGTHTIVFSVYPGFTLVHYHEIGPTLHYLDFPAGSNHLWLPPIVADPEDLQAFYFCGQYLYRGRWTGADNVTYTNNPQNFTTAGGSYLSAFAISPVDLDRRLASTDSGELWYSADRGATWTHSPDQGPSSHYFYGNALVCSPLDAQRAWLGGSGYSGPAVYRTDDGGVSWTPLGDGLPPTLVYMLATQGPDSETLYAATESGPYRLEAGSSTWQYIGDGVPLTLFWSVEAVPAMGVMRFGTYGRGIWDFDASAVTAAPATPTAPLALASFPNPFNPQTTLRFALDAPGRATLSIYDVRGRAVRQLLAAALPAGEMTVTWDGRDEAGHALPSGVYFARLTAAGQVDSERLTLLR
ncbi:MAG: T9SS type A sorting domain-containing protein [Candidatus Latescibacteria bacterium]|nr:T9SS type A sorting domain-containing protein [Candidatus Latescibacterota bacterium]